MGQAPWPACRATWVGVSHKRLVRELCDSHLYTLLEPARLRRRSAT